MRKFFQMAQDIGRFLSAVICLNWFLEEFVTSVRSPSFSKDFVPEARGQLQEGEQELGQGVDTGQALDEVLQPLPPRFQHLGARVPDSLGWELWSDQAQLLTLLVEAVEGGVSV